MFLTSMDETEL